MGQILSQPFTRDIVHISKIDGFERFIGASAEYMEKRAEAEKLRVERKIQRMKERQAEEDGDRRKGNSPPRFHGHEGRELRRHKGKVQDHYDCKSFALLVYSPSR